MINKTPFAPAPKITSIKVGNVCRSTGAQKFMDAIQGQTYMNFNVFVCPVGGSFDVIVETSYQASKKDITAMLMDLMFDLINH
jgi:hypothetical protein